MMQFMNDTLILMYENDTMQILQYINHNSDNFNISRKLNITEVQELFGKSIIKGKF